MDKTEGFVSVDGGRIWYRSLGTGGIPLLLLHGGPGAGHDYLEPLEALAADRPQAPRAPVDGLDHPVGPVTPVAPVAPSDLRKNCRKTCSAAGAAASAPKPPFSISAQTTMSGGSALFTGP